MKEGGKLVAGEKAGTGVHGRKTGRHLRRTALHAIRAQGARTNFVMWDWPEHKISRVHSISITAGGVTPVEAEKHSLKIAGTGKRAPDVASWFYENQEYA